MGADRDDHRQAQPEAAHEREIKGVARGARFEQLLADLAVQLRAARAQHLRGTRPARCPSGLGERARPTRWRSGSGWRHGHLGGPALLVEEVGRAPVGEARHDELRHPLQGGLRRSGGSERETRVGEHLDGLFAAAAGGDVGGEPDHRAGGSSRPVAHDMGARVQPALGAALAVGQAELAGIAVGALKRGADERGHRVAVLGVHVRQPLLVVGRGGSAGHAVQGAEVGRPRDHVGRHVPDPAARLRALEGEAQRLLGEAVVGHALHGHRRGPRERQERDGDRGGGVARAREADGVGRLPRFSSFSAALTAGSARRAAASRPASCRTAALARRTVPWRSTSASPVCACSNHCSRSASGAPVTAAFGLS